MTRERDDRERLLASVLAGERDDADPTFLAALRADPALAARLRQLRAVQQAVKEDLVAAADDIAAAQRQTTAADRALVSDFVQGRNRHRRRTLLALAAAVLAALVWLNWPGGATPRTRGPLGDGGSIRVDRVSDGLRATFPGALPPSGFRRVRLLCTGPDAVRERLELDTTENPWMLPEAWSRAIDASVRARLLVSVQDPVGTAEGPLLSLQLK